MSTANSNKLKSKLKSMSTPKKRRKRTVNRAPVRRRTVRRKPTTRKRSLSSSGSSKKVTFMEAGKTALGGMAGGAVYTAPQFLFKAPLWLKVVYGFGGAVIASKLGGKSIGAGMAGAMTLDVAKQFLSTSLKDDLNNVDYVDPSTLSDTGMTDQEGNSIVMDDDGSVYALNDEGDYQYIGEGEDYNLSENDMNTVSMLPMCDPYALQDVYALNDNMNY